MGREMARQRRRFRQQRALQEGRARMYLDIAALEAIERAVLQQALVEQIDRHLHRIERQPVERQIDLRAVVGGDADLGHRARALQLFQKRNEALGARLAQVVGPVQQQAVDRSPPQQRQRALQGGAALLDLGRADAVGRQRRQFRHDAHVAVRDPAPWPSTLSLSP